MLENDVVADVPTVVYGPPLVVARRMVYEVAPAEAAHERLICDEEAAVAMRPVGAAGGVQAAPAGVTEVQVDGEDAAASLPEGWPVTW